MPRSLLFVAALAAVSCSRKPAAPPPPSPPPLPVAVAEKMVDLQRGPFGDLSITCEPQCRLWLDGADTGFDSPVKKMPVRAGPHELRLVTPDGQVESLSFYMDPGGTYERAFQLQR